MNHLLPIKRIFSISLFVAMALGCASTVPDAIRTPPPSNPGVEQVRSNTPEFVGRPVRWGGTIARVENKQTETWLEIVEKELRRGGQPLISDQSQGRFIARLQGFFDPAIYEKGRHVTVAGKLENATVDTIGEFTYVFPVVTVETLYLWEPEPETLIIEPVPYWYYDPWFYRYPYYYRHPYYPRRLRHH